MPEYIQRCLWLTCSALQTQFLITWHESRGDTKVQLSEWHKHAVGFIRELTFITPLKVWQSFGAYCLISAIELQPAASTEYIQIALDRFNWVCGILACLVIDGYQVGRMLLLYALTNPLQMGTTRCNTHLDMQPSRI